MCVFLVLLMMKCFYVNLQFLRFESQSQKAKFTQMAAPQKSALAEHHLCGNCHENMEIYICNVKYVFLENFYRNMIAGNLFFLIK